MQNKKDVVTHGMNMRVYFKVDLNFSCLELNLTFNLLKKGRYKTWNRYQSAFESGSEVQLFGVETDI